MKDCRFVHTVAAAAKVQLRWIMHMVNSFSGGHWYSYLWFFPSTVNKLSHGYSNEDLHHMAAVQTHSFSLDLCVCVTCWVWLYHLTQKLHTPLPWLSPKQQPMNKLINFTGPLALCFQNKGQKTEEGGLKQCDSYHKLGSDIWLCSATVAILLLTLLLCNLSGFSHYTTRWFQWPCSLFLIHSFKDTALLKTIHKVSL